ncbi:AgmX/PglI C-terminal domain-containing protein [Enhygromyxa salina]|uniref:Gram-negative bacterial tonB protein n=1 Tax=Enhygromyxa salina TaxID=215803 RepID=A0A2S9YRJ1_9BACT|nr:AgmX/PglI C-terminal domain-containing protein [Enhygromyxa salina]PRQ07713.1 hypothetical protein ENSA7_27030 [Enhygromyxa salina]
MKLPHPAAQTNYHRGMRSVTGPRLLLLPTLGLALACASPKDASAPEAEQASVDPAQGSPSEAAKAELAPSATPMAEPEPAMDAEAMGEGESKPLEAPAASRPSRDSFTGQLEIQVPMINGGLNRDIIRRTASDHADDIRTCHGRALAATPGLAGTLVVALTIDADGSVSAAEVGERSAFASRDVEACVVALARGWQFPKPSDGERASVELAFDFGL